MRWISKIMSLYLMINIVTDDKYRQQKSFTSLALIPMHCCAWSFM
jgi:uncharacterized membrane protein YqjE